MHAEGTERLRDAGEALLRDDEGCAMALLAAAVMFDLPPWPAELREHALSLQESLFGRGPVAVEQMAEPERLQFRRELAAFLDLAGRV